MRIINQMSFSSPLLDPKISVWLDASAGTGKTYNLSERIKSLLLNGTEPHKILCLSFSTAAANEIHQRILEDLRRWTNLNEEELLSEIKSFIDNGKPNKEQIQNARTLFFQIQEATNTIRIQTIHAFCYSLLKLFPFESDTPLFFEIIDQRKTEELMSRAIYSELDTLDEKDISIIQSSIADITLSKYLKSNQGYKVDTLLKLNSGTQNTINILAKELGVEIHETPDLIIKESSYNHSLEYIRLMEGYKVLLAGNKEDQQKGEIIKEWLEKDIDERSSYFSINKYMSAFLTRDGQIRKVLATKKSESIIPTLELEAQRVFKLNQKIKRTEMLIFTNSFLKLYEKFLYQYTILKRNENFLDYNDLIYHANQLLRKNVESEWVRFKLDGGFDHLLIDEAQDTNRQQWNIIDALTEEMITREKTSIFIVGDRKQSIYSFQDVDVNDFNKQKDYYRNLISESGKKWHEEELNKNYRSTSAILETVDKVFNETYSSKGVKTEKIIKHEPSDYNKNIFGLIEISPEEEEEEEEPQSKKTSGWQHFHDPYTPPRDRIQNLAKEISQKINDIIQKKEQIFDKERKCIRTIESGDIIILLRNRGELLNKIKREIKKLNYNVSSSDKRVLSNHLIVKDLIAIGRFILLPEDDFNLAIVLKGPFIANITESDLFTLLQNRKGRSLWSTLQESQSEEPKIKNALSFLKKVLEIKEAFSPLSIYSYLFNNLDGKRKIISRLGPEAEEIMEDFINEALEFEKNNIPSLEGFIDDLDKNQLENNKRQNQEVKDAIRIMTIHGAKGLESPIVFLPLEAPYYESKTILFPETSNKNNQLIVALNSSYRNQYSEEIKKKDRIGFEEEENRLFYVAMTRASQRLYIYGNRKESKAYDSIHEVNRGEKIIKSGTKPKEKIIKTKKPINSSLPDYFSIPEKDTLLPENSSPSKIGMPKTATLSPLSNESNKYFLTGSIIHKLLEIIPELNKKDQRNACINYLSKKIESISDKQVEQITNEAMAIIEKPEFSHLFEKSSRTEIPISYLINNIKFTGSIDRIIFNDNQLSIIDYKTNSQPPKSINKIEHSYLLQMSVYYQAIRELYETKNIKCYFLWTKIPSIMEIPENLLSSAWIKFLNDK